MATANFGYQPAYCAVHLTPKGNFIAELRTPDGSDWPGTAAVTMYLETAVETVWPATLTGPSASWNIPAATVAGLYKQGLAVRVEGTDTGSPDSPIVWFLGNVVWHG